MLSQFDSTSVPVAEALFSQLKRKNGLQRIIVWCWFLTQVTSCGAAAERTTTIAAGGGDSTISSLAPLDTRTTTATDTVMTTTHLGAATNETRWSPRAVNRTKGGGEFEEEEDVPEEIGQPPLPPQRQVMGPPVTQCAMSEHTCNNGKCIPLNKYCDNVNDCGDSSDEPRFCSRCNRTYFGNIGMTYDIELHRPKEDKIPYVCMLTFTAAGGSHGDIVQIMLDSFTIGRFASYTQDGCPDGYLQISEAFRQGNVGGMWCGSSWGPVMFYSETRSLILTVKLFKLARDQAGYNFDFRIQFKVLSKESALVRYGGIKQQEIRPWYSDTPLNTTQPTVSSTQQSPLTYNFTKISNKKFQSTKNVSIFEDQIFGKKNTNPSEQRRNREGGGGRKGKKQLSGGDLDTAGGGFSNETEFDSGNYSEPKYYLGKLIQGTYCSRVFNDCDKRHCRLQSPNFPGVYPRNLTCFYAIRQYEAPPGKHAVISVRQPKGNLIWISTPMSQSSVKNEKEKFMPRISTWDECDHVQDYITVYDGYTTRDPVMLKFCGGGQSLPPTVSSGPELLVEFTTSPFGTFHNVPPTINGLNGFQLEVEVKFVDAKSPNYVENKKLCEFWIRGTGKGILENPKHSIPPNTTCLYHLQGTDVTPSQFPLDHIQIPRRGSSNSLPPPTRFKVWISVLKFDLAAPFGLQDDSTNMLQPTPEDCTGLMRIWDGPLRESPQCKDVNCEKDPAARIVGGSKYGQNFTNILARYCRGRIPRSCEYNLLNQSSTKPCLISESYISSSEFLTLEIRNTESTALRPLSFKLKYEFVDLHQDGIPAISNVSNDCNRRFVSNLLEKKELNTFRSVKNVFLFGRGGTKNLTCIHKFEAQRGERIRVVIRKVMTGINRTCESRIDEDTDRSYCFGDSRVKVEILEKPWHDSIPFFRGCMCNSTNSTASSNASTQVSMPVIYTSSSRELEVHFSAINMTDFDDPEHIYFEGTFEFIKAPLHCKDNRRKYGASGLVDLSAGEMECRSRPWLIEPTSGVTANEKFLYVRLYGLELYRFDPVISEEIPSSFNAVQKNFNKNSIHCGTKARVIVTTGEKLSVTICPIEEDDASSDQIVEIFSSGWNKKFSYLSKESPKQISVELIEPEARHELAFSWLEMSRFPIQGLFVGDCQYQCPELDACVNSSVWCNGKSDCPSGYDESFTHCSPLLQLPAEILAALSAFAVALCCGFSAVLFRKLRMQFRGSSVLQTRLKSLSSMDTAVFDEKDVIC